MDSRIIKITIFATLAILVTATVLMPVISDARMTAGAEITKINEGTGHTFKEMVPGDVLSCESVYSDSSRTDTWTLNGDVVLNEGVTSLTWDWGLISDVMYVYVNSSSNAAVGGVRTITTDAGVSTSYTGATSDTPSRTYQWEMNDDYTITFTNYTGDTVSSTTTYSSTWAYTLASIEDGAYMSAQVTTNEYYDSKDGKNIILAGSYNSGDLDTGYYYVKDGELTILNTSYTGSIEFEQTLSDGTTDIYDTLVTVSVTDGSTTEVFSPYRALVPYEVTGHESSGAAYSLYGVIPIMVIMSILLGVVAIVLRSRMD